MVSGKEEDSLTARIIELISNEPQTLVSLISHTHSTSAKVSWICQNLRSQGVIDLDREGIFYLSEVRSEPSGQN
ncbi:hypothetical protein ON05_008765 [Acaryochloris sp. CCMEE 5410]|nr:hypothetical protein ON05_008765 [Acaryochloris sp. CCMEE 5410]